MALTGTKVAQGSNEQPTSLSLDVKRDETTENPVDTTAKQSLDVSQVLTDAQNNTLSSTDLLNIGAQLGSAVATHDGLSDPGKVSTESVGVTLGETKVEVPIPQTTLSASIINYIPYFAVMIAGVIAFIANMFNWGLPVSEQQLADEINVVMFAVVTAVGLWGTWRHNPVTKQAVLKSKLGEEALQQLKEKQK